MKTHIHALLATLGHLLVDRFERRVNMRHLAKTISFTPSPVPGFVHTQIKPPPRWHRVSMFTPEIPHVHCYLCKRLAPWELADPCPGPRT